MDLEGFVAVRGPALLRLAWLLTADAEAAQDLVQEALARVVPRWESIREGGHEAYVRTAVRSVWIDRWRRQRVRWDSLDNLEEPQAEDQLIEGTAERLALDAALARLTPRQRAVLVLRFYEDQTERETARALGCSVNTVKSQTRHALERLRQLSPELDSADNRADDQADDRADDQEVAR